MKRCSICHEEFSIGGKVCPICVFNKKPDKVKLLKKEIDNLWIEVDKLTEIVNEMSEYIKKYMESFAK